MTIKELSEKTGIPINTLYSITKRDSLRVDRVILERISKALNVDTYDLYPEEMRGAAILADTVKGAGLSFKGSNGNKNRSEQGRLECLRKICRMGRNAEIGFQPPKTRQQQNA